MYEMEEEEKDDRSPEKDIKKMIELLSSIGLGGEEIGIGETYRSGEDGEVDEDGNCIHRPLIVTLTNEGEKEKLVSMAKN